MNRIIASVFWAGLTGCSEIILSLTVLWIPDTANFKHTKTATRMPDTLTSVCVNWLISSNCPLWLGLMSRPRRGGLTREYLISSISSLVTARRTSLLMTCLEPEMTAGQIHEVKIQETGLCTMQDKEIFHTNKTFSADVKRRIRHQTLWCSFCCHSCCYISCCYTRK